MTTKLMLLSASVCIALVAVSNADPIEASDASHLAQLQNASLRGYGKNDSLQPKVGIPLERYSFHIKNELNVDLFRTKLIDHDGWIEKEGSLVIKPGEQTQIECKANYLGGLNCYIGYSADLADETVSVEWHVHADLAQSAFMQSVSISQKSPLIKYTKIGKTWNVHDKCPEGWCWDSEVLLCVRCLPPKMNTSVVQGTNSYNELASSTAGQVAGAFVEFGLGKIPVVGKLLKNLASAFWPQSGPSPQEVWDSIEKYAEELFDRKISEYAKKDILLTLQSVSDQLDDIPGAEKERKGPILIAAYTQLETLKVRVTQDFDSYFSVTIPVISLHLTAAAMYIDVDNEIWETPLSDSLRAERYAEINDDLSYRYKLAQLKEQFAQERGNTLFDQRVVDIEMDVYWDMARVWPHAVRDLNLTMITQPLDIPDRKNYFFPVGVKSPDSSFTDVAQTHIWELVIRSGDWLDGIRVRHDGGITSGFHGQLSGQGTVVYLEDDEYINGITGRASNRVFQFVMETTTGRTLQFPFTDTLGRGEPFWTGIPIAPRLGRQVLLAVHGGGESSTQINQLYFEFGPVPGQSLANTTSLKPSNQK